MQLEREVTCLRSLTWRCDLPPDLAPRVLDRLLAEGWGTVHGSPGLSVIRSAELHEIVLVLRSGRVQIRVHYTVPEDERRHAAERVFVALVRAACDPRLAS
jgi:hypothetical protein